MTIKYGIGRVLVSPEEYEQRYEDIKRFVAGISPEATLSIGRGEVTGEEVLNPAVRTSNFQQIGIGKPLVIEIYTIYTGNAPSRLFGGRPALLVTSGVKTPETFDAAPKAINLLKDNIKDYEYLLPGAFEKGSPYVYYSPSVVNPKTYVSFELNIDKFDETLFNAMDELFVFAAGIPVFAPAATHLLAGSTITKIFTKLGKVFLEDEPYLNNNLTLAFGDPVLPDFIADSILVCEDEFSEELDKYEIRLIGGGPGKQYLALVEPSTGKRYEGEASYLIAVIDGRVKDNLANFTPTLASAAILDQFYRPKDPQAEIVDAMKQAMSLYNDLEYNKKAQELKKKLKDLDPKSEEYKKLKAIFDGYNTNIKDEHFKVELKT